MKRRLYKKLLLGAIVLLQVLGSEVAVAQKKALKKADKHYDKFEYVRAIAEYQKAVDDGAENAEIKIKIAHSYQKLNDQVNAEKWYAMAEEQSHDVFAPHDELMYANSLSSVGKYDKAEKYYKQYESMQGDDKRVKSIIQGLEARNDFYLNEKYISVEEASFNSVHSDFAPAFYEGNLVFASARNNRADVYPWDNSKYLDIYQVDNASGDITLFNDQINSKYHEGPVVFYDNYRRVIFTRNNYVKGKFGESKNGVNKLKLYQAEKIEGEWSDPEPLSFNDENYSVGHPAISSDGEVLYFASDMPGGYGGVDLYKSTYANGEWGKPENLGDVINTEGDEMFPFLTDNNELYFATNGHKGLGGLDICGVKLDNDHLSVINIGSPINTSKDDFSLILNDDMRSGYFSSNRKDGKNNDDIYLFTTDKPLLTTYRLFGKVLAQNDQQPIGNVKVSLTDADGAVVDELETNEDGEFTFMVDPDKGYSLKATKDEYFDGFEEFTASFKGDETEYEKNLSMAKDYGFSLLGIVTDSDSKAEIEDVHVVLIDNMTGETVLNTKTNSQGSFRNSVPGKQLNDRVSYQVKLEKEGYLGKSLIYNAELKSPGEIKLNSALNLSLDKIAIGTDIGKLIDVKPIYFDVNKSVIRPDAAKELDKIVAVMKENPSIEIELASHTDSRGSDEYNLKLSDKRAKASAAYIVSKGIDEGRIQGIGYGESKLVNRCGNNVKCSENEHQQNRRTEFNITKM